MKVLVLAPPRNRPGRITAMTFIDEELMALVDRGIEPHVLSTACREREVITGVHLRPVPSGRSAGALAANVRFLISARERVPLSRREASRLYTAIRVEREAAQLVAREGFMLIHSHFGAPAGCGGTLAARATGRPLVASFRGMDLLSDAAQGYGLRLSAHYDRRIRRLVRRADRTIYVSDFMRRRGIELGADPARADTVRKGVDLTRFTPERAPKAVPPIVLVVANLLRRKRVDHVLRALCRLPSSLDFRVEICGEGPEEPKLRKLAADLGLAERITFHGWIERAEIPSRFARASILVLPTVQEASGNVLLEAQASGTPAICMASGGAPEYVRDGRTGFVVPTESEEALADRLARLLNDADLRQRLSTAAREYAVSALGYERMIDGIMKVYMSVTASTAAAGRSTRLAHPAGT